MTECCTQTAGIVSCQRLRSASQRKMIVPRYRMDSYGRRCFAVAGQSTWNSLTDKNSASFINCYCYLLMFLDTTNTRQDTDWPCFDMLPLFASRRPRAKDAAACQSKVDRRSRWVKRFQEWWMNDVQLKVVDIARPHAEHNSTRPSMCLKLCHHRNSFIAQRCKKTHRFNFLYKYSTLWNSEWINLGTRTFSEFIAAWSTVHIVRRSTNRRRIFNSDVNTLMWSLVWNQVDKVRGESGLGWSLVQAARVHSAASCHHNPASFYLRRELYCLPGPTSRRWHHHQTSRRYRSAAQILTTVITHFTE